MKLTHWSYSFVMATCNLGNEYRLGTNPFTGEKVKFPIDDGLTKQQVRKVKNVFMRNGVTGPEPDFEGYAACGLDGESVRFRGVDLNTDRVVSLGVEITVKRLTNEIISLVFDVAAAGDFALMTNVGDCVRVVNCEYNDDLLERWPDLQPISSVPELQLWIEEQVGGQKVYGNVSRSMLEQIARENEKLRDNKS